MSRVLDGKENMSLSGWADDGADESIVSACIAEKAVLNGTSKMSKFNQVKLQVNLKAASNAEMFSFLPHMDPTKNCI